MMVINFSHKLTQSQLRDIERLAGQPIESVIDVPTRFDNSQPFELQARNLVDAAGLLPEKCQSAQFLINLPGFNCIAALVVAELHGRMGHFPSIIRLRPLQDSTPTEFEVAEILNLQQVRDKARALR